MTRTGPADVAMSACRHASASRPVLARPGFRELVSVWPLSHGPTVFRAVFPGSAFLKPASCRLAGRSRRPQSSPRFRRTGPSGHRVLRGRRVRGRPRSHIRFTCTCQSGAVLPGSPFDPGRDVLCILTSPPRWLQWP